jgi:polyisoprenoid-binding protein YceI
MLRIVTLFALVLLTLNACASAPPSPVAPTTAPVAPATVLAAPGAPTVTTSPSSSTSPIDPKANGVAYTFQVVPAESQVEYAVQELFFGRPTAQTTIGSTKTVEGQFTAEMRAGKLILQANQFEVDLRTLQSDNQVRDQAIRSNWLESNKYPFAEFTSTNLQGLPPELKEGVATPFKVDGNMTIRGITKPVTFSASATLTGDKLTGTGTTLLFMKDYGFSAPDLAGRLTVTDGVTLTVRGTAKLVQGAKP